MVTRGQGVDPELLRRLLRAKDRMTAAPERDWSVADCAQVAGVSEHHFARSFKAAFGVPPHRYLLSLRLERAAARLRDTDDPILDIALATGWRSLGTFGRTFREVMGATPTAYRAEARREAEALEPVPACIARAFGRPDLRIAVLEKRRRGPAS